MEERNKPPMGASAETDSGVDINGYLDHCIEECANNSGETPCARREEPMGPVPPPPPPHKPRRRRRRRLILFFVILLTLAAVLLITIAYMGLGGGTVAEAFATLKKTPELSPAAEATPLPTDPAPVISTEQGVITVREDQIFYMGSEVTVDTLREKILGEHSIGMAWELVDAHAIKGSYDAVRALFDELSIPVSQRMAE